MSTHEERQQVKEAKQNVRPKPESEAEEEFRETELLDLANNMTVAMLRRKLQQHGQKVSNKQNKAQLAEAYVDLMKKVRESYLIML